MSIRRVRGSFKGSIRRFASVETTKKCPRDSTLLFHNGEWKIVYDDGDEVTLMYAKHEKIPMKDFGAEIRASMDVSRFLTKAVLLLDVNEMGIDRIVDVMLRKVLDNRSEEPHSTVAEAKNTLFTHNAAHLLAKTLQGTCIRDGGGFEYDQSWIVALCNLPSLSQRHVAVARLRIPANMGHTCHEVRFFILVLCPSKEKLIRKKSLKMSY